MTETIEVTVKLPADLVRDAREFDVLTDEAVAQLIQTAVEKRINEFVNEEIHAYRREKHAKPSSRT